MDLDGLRREFADAVAAGAHAPGQAARMRPAREAAARRCLMPSDYRRRINRSTRRSGRHPRRPIRPRDAAAL